MNAYDIIAGWLDEPETYPIAPHKRIVPAGSPGDVNHMIAVAKTKDAGEFLTPDAADAANAQAAQAQAAKNKRELDAQQRQIDAQDKARAAAAARANRTHAPFLPGAARDSLHDLGNAPTPGGLGPLLLALLFFIMAIVPVGPRGETRVQLIFRSLLGGTAVPPTHADRVFGAGPVNASGVTDSLQQIGAQAQAAAGQAAAQAGQAAAQGVASQVGAAASGAASEVGSAAWWALQGVATGGAYP